MNHPNSRAVWAFGTAVLGGMAAGATVAHAADTPRDADGHPILAGLYASSGVGGISEDDVGNVARNFQGRGNSYVGLEADGGLRRTSNDNWPIYKPEYWDQITENDYNGNWDDPVYSCLPLGVPRLGIPHQIVKVEGQPAVILIYHSGFNGYNGSYSSWDGFRWIWTDGRDHDQQSVAAETLNGDGIGHWEGDSLVIESVGFTDTSWLHKNGWVHGFDMKVTERLTRVGDTLVWEATVDDPEYLMQPWRMTPMVAKLRATDNYIHQSNPCLVVEPLTSHVRSG